MEDLTISTHLNALLRATRRLRAPRDYFEGLSLSAPILPEGLLMFARRHSSELGGVPHAHHRFVLLTALAGHGQVVVDQVSHTLEPDRAVLVFPFQFHHYVFSRSTRVTWLFTTFELPSESPLEPLRARTLSLDPRVLEDLEIACAAFTVRPQARVAEQAALRVSLVLTALLGTVPGRRSRGIAVRGQGELLERVGRYVFVHLHEPISVATLARAVGMSPTHLRQQLRERYGLSPHGYVRQVKMLQAMRLLRSSERRVSQIADELGFSSLFSFSRTFKLETGVSPRTYRKQHSDVIAGRPSE